MFGWGFVCEDIFVFLMLFFAVIVIFEWLLYGYKERFWLGDLYFISDDWCYFWCWLVIYCIEYDEFDVDDYVG